MRRLQSLRFPGSLALPLVLLVVRFLIHDSDELQLFNTPLSSAQPLRSYTPAPVPVSSRPGPGRSHAASWPTDSFTQQLSTAPPIQLAAVSARPHLGKIFFISEGA
uniref:Uncharacterized protein n=1 Tax=Mycena chlorophos TaxID=658473 RepID=A0ABQ0LAD5_MYCCL|nr:predicted protein [Mycena chlorophos]